MALPLKQTTSEISDQDEHRCSLAKYPALRISSITQFTFITDCYKERERERERERETQWLSSKERLTGDRRAASSRLTRGTVLCLEQVTLSCA